MANGEVRNDGLTQKTAYVINEQFGAQSGAEVKKAVNEELQRLLKNGEITKDEAKAAKRFLDNEIASALVRRNNVERTNYETVYGFDDLDDPKADKLMKDAGLTINDLYEASKLAGIDYEVSYTHLSKDERKKAENGEVTSSELKNIQNALNEKIKANGGDKVLTEKETKQLMKGLGLSIESKFNIPKVLLSMIGLGEAGAIAGLLGKSSATAVVTASTEMTTVTATAKSSSRLAGAAGGLVAGTVIGGGVEVVRQANRKEKPFGEQDASAGGAGSVTNKTESKMAEVGTKATEAFENGDLPSQPPLEDPILNLLEDESY